MKELNTFRQYLAESIIKEDYENDYNSSSYDLVKDMTFEKVKDVIQYHKVDPSEVIADLISRFGLSAEFLSEGVTADEITSRVRKLGKEKGIEDEYIEDYIDELDGNFEPDAYENSTDKDLLDDLKSYIDLND